MKSSKIKTESTLILITVLLIPNIIAYGQSEEIFYCTFLGGSMPDRIRDVCLDSQGNIIIVGGTYSEDFPISNAVQETYGGGELENAEYFSLTGEAFVAKFSHSHELLWSTYLGGSGLEEGLNVLVGAEDEIIVFGVTTSTDFPVTMDSSSTVRETGDQFIAMYTPDGALIGARLYVPDEIERINDVKLDSSGNIVMGGYTSSQSMYTTEDALKHELTGETDGFVRVVTYDLESILYSTYVGGSGTEYLGEVAVGQDDSIYATISTGSHDFPVTENGLRSEFLGDETDNALIKIDQDRNLAVSTFFGGSGIDHMFDLCEGRDNSMIIVGRSWSSDYPVTSDALQTEYSEIEVDGILTEFSASGDELLYSTYYGKEGWDSLLQVNMDEAGRLVISGFVDSNGFETVNAFQSEYMGSTELIVMIMDGDDFELISYLGGYYYEHPFAQQIHDGVVYLVGQTASPQFPVSEEAYQTTQSGAEDGYLWIMDYDAYLSGDIEIYQGGSGWLTPSLRNYLAYSFIVGAIIVWALYMRRYFSESS